MRAMIRDVSREALLIEKTSYEGQAARLSKSAVARWLSSWDWMVDQ